MNEKVKRALENISNMSKITSSIVKGGLLTTAAILLCGLVMLIFAGPPGAASFRLNTYALEMIRVGQAVFLVTILGSVIVEQTIHKR